MRRSCAEGPEVEYSLRAIPLGGFVAFPDDDPDCPYPAGLSPLTLLHHSLPSIRRRSTRVLTEVHFVVFNRGETVAERDGTTYASRREVNVYVRV